nr:unnamed protein product [Callosobruchus analis]
MRIKAAGPHLPVVNYDVPAQEASFRKHGALFGGESKRALIVGASGSGKTNIMISLITHPNGLRFSNVYLYCKFPIPTEISIPTQRVATAEGYRVFRVYGGEGHHTSQPHETQFSHHF